MKDVPCLFRSSQQFKRTTLKRTTKIETKKCTYHVTLFPRGFVAGVGVNVDPYSSMENFPFKLFSLLNNEINKFAYRETRGKALT